MDAPVGLELARLVHLGLEHLKLLPQCEHVRNRSDLCLRQLHAVCVHRDVIGHVRLKVIEHHFRVVRNLWPVDDEGVCPREFWAVGGRRAIVDGIVVTFGRSRTVLSRLYVTQSNGHPSLMESAIMKSSNVSVVPITSSVASFS